MANIQTYLEQIKNAIYGRDVRQAIHDAIHQCYKDGRAGKEDLIAREGIDEIKANIANPNLLINSDFRNPVNQRGETTYAPTGNYACYTIDRWFIFPSSNDGVGHSLTVNDGYITFANSNANMSAFMCQRFEKPLSGKFTISIKVKATSKLLSLNYRDGGTLYRAMDLAEGLNTATIECTSLDMIRINISQDASIDIEWIKLEQGKIATPFVPRFYAEDLMMSQRYYTRLSTTYPMLVTQRTSSETTTYIYIPTPQSLRDAPSVEFANVKLLKGGVGGAWMSVTNVTCVGYSNMGVTLQLECEGALEANIPYYLILPNSGYIKLDAEIR